MAEDRKPVGNPTPTDEKPADDAKSDLEAVGNPTPDLKAEAKTKTRKQRDLKAEAKRQDRDDREAKVVPREHHFADDYLPPQLMQ